MDCRSSCASSVTFGLLAADPPNIANVGISGMQVFGVVDYQELLPIQFLCSGGLVPDSPRSSLELSAYLSGVVTISIYR